MTMLILGFKEGHDGSIAAIEDGRLIFSLEAEKDNFPRYYQLTAEVLNHAANKLDRLPDVMAIGGWTKGTYTVDPPSRTGYFGVGELAISDELSTMFGKQIRVFSSTHERSHIMSAHGMSPLPLGQAAYCLVWEGNIGSFYRIDEVGRVTHLKHVLTDPGNKYAYLFALADAAFPLDRGLLRLQDAGKQMALAGFAQSGSVNDDEKKIIDFLLTRDGVIREQSKREMTWSRFHNIGVESQEFKNVAAKLSDAIFEQFWNYAVHEMTEQLPLLIAGGCGLNCEWNRKWRESGLFTEVFIPPCPNDSGSALGTAIDAQHHYTGSSKIAWSVYAGLDFVEDTQFESAQFSVRKLDYDEVADFIASGKVVSWVQGKYEMGPRALGNRSILAAPFEAKMTDRLNQIKQRESYRPIAPVCLASAAGEYFEGSLPDPYMLYFSRVKARELPAVTHVDGTARVQTVSANQNAKLAALLMAFQRKTGYAVLCNTSLNFSGRGFINRTSDLIEYGQRHGLDGYIVGDIFATPS
jgi:predicted NodU family carbamoyl transferase